MAATVKGRHSWTVRRDDEGHREYKIRWKVESETSDGPANVLLASGLPLPGTVWGSVPSLFESDSDPWAWCRLEADVQAWQPPDGGGRHKHWLIEQTFSTKPGKRCCDQQFDDPLLEPPKISGTFVRYTEEGNYDRFGDPIRTSSHEVIRGPHNEWDASRAQVTIEMNLPSLDLQLLASSVDTVNDDWLWDLPPRSIKLSGSSWQRKFHGQCNVYFTVSLEFDIKYEGWDRDLDDEGTCVIRGSWVQAAGTDDQYYWQPVRVRSAVTQALVDIDHTNPVNFQRYKDLNGENRRVVLDGQGRPWDPNRVEVEGWWCVEKADYSQSTVFGTCDDAETEAGVGGVFFGPFGTDASDQSQVNDACNADASDNYPAVQICPGPDSAGKVPVEYYQESNFLLLGIPLDISL
jgi:hypothetical protein